MARKGCVNRATTADGIFAGVNIREKGTKRDVEVDDEMRRLYAGAMGRELWFQVNRINADDPEGRWKKWERAIEMKEEMERTKEKMIEDEDDEHEYEWA